MKRFSVLLILVLLLATTSDAQVRIKGRKKPPPAVPPTAPSGLVAVVSGTYPTTNINVTWTDNATTETGFSLERCTGSAAACAVSLAFAAVYELPQNSLGISNSGLTAATTYTYRVRAFNSAGNSAYTTPDDATTTDPGGNKSYFFKDFEDGLLTPFTTSCRQNPGNVVCDEVNNFKCTVSSVAPISGTKSVVCTAMLEQAWQNNLVFRTGSGAVPANPSVTDTIFWWGGELQVDANTIACISGGTTQVNQQKFVLNRNAVSTGGSIMPMFGKLLGIAPANDDLNANADGDGKALHPDTGSQHLLDLAADTTFTIKGSVSRNITTGKGTTAFYFKDGGVWKRANWSTLYDAIIEVPNNQYTNSKIGWDDTTLQMVFRAGQVVIESYAAGGACTGLSGTTKIDNIWAGNYDQNP